MCPIELNLLREHYINLWPWTHDRDISQAIVCLTPMCRMALEHTQALWLVTHCGVCLGSGDGLVEAPMLHHTSIIAAV